MGHLEGWVQPLTPGSLKTSVSARCVEYTSASQATRLARDTVVSRLAPVRGQQRTRHGAPGAEDGGAKRGERAVQHVEGQAGGHAAVLNADFDRDGATIATLEPAQA